MIFWVLFYSSPTKSDIQTKPDHTNYKYKCVYPERDNQQTGQGYC
jgi:hypothetical protein